MQQLGLKLLFSEEESALLAGLGGAEEVGLSGRQGFKKFLHNQ